MLEHTIRLHTRETIYLNLSLFTLYHLARYILSYQIYSLLHLKMMTWSHRNVV